MNNVTEVRVGPRSEGLDVRVRPRCFMLMTSAKDMSGVAEHGDAVVLFADGERRPSFWSDAYVREALVRLRREGYDPTVDLLVASGNVVPLVTVACALTHERGLPPRLLCFDAQRQGFVVR